MKLPNAQHARVEEDKIFGYLLNPEHQYGASKARFFAAFGFTAENWQTLAKALLDHGQTHDVTRVRETGFGPRYEIEGVISTPDGRNPRLRTVWQLDKGEIAPRLITAYPLEKL